MPDPMANENEDAHPAIAVLGHAYPKRTQKRQGSEIASTCSEEVLASLKLSYADPMTGTQLQIKTKEDFEKTEVFSSLSLLYRGVEGLSPSLNMDEITAGLSALDRQLDADPNTVKALPENLRAILVSVASRVLAAQEVVAEHFQPPGTQDVKERWPERDKSLKESPIQFAERVYARWIGKGLERGHLRHIDPKLYKAIDNWSQKPGNSIPEDLLPSSYKHYGDIAPTELDQEIYNKRSALYMRAYRDRKKIGTG